MLCRIALKRPFSITAGFYGANGEVWETYDDIPKDHLLRKISVDSIYDYNLVGLRRTRFNANILKDYARRYGPLCSIVIKQEKFHNCNAYHWTYYFKYLKNVFNDSKCKFKYENECNMSGLLAKSTIISNKYYSYYEDYVESDYYDR